MGNYKIWKLNTNPSIKRVCAICKKPYPATKDYFKGNKTKSLGLDFYCKKCCGLRNRSRFIPVNTDESIKKKCNSCGKNYPATLRYFNRAKNRNLGIIYKCKWCRQFITKEYRVRIGIEISKKWNFDHREQVALYAKSRRLKLGLDSRMSLIARMNHSRGDTV